MANPEWENHHIYSEECPCSSCMGTVIFTLKERVAELEALVNHWKGQHAGKAHSLGFYERLCGEHQEHVKTMEARLAERDELLQEMLDTRNVCTCWPGCTNECGGPPSQLAWDDWAERIEAMLPAGPEGANG